MLNYHDTKQIRTSKEFREFVIKKLERGYAIKQVAEMAGHKFGIPMNHKYLNGALRNWGRPELRQQHPTPRPASMYNKEIDLS